VSVREILNIAGLEVITHRPEGAARGAPLVFVHGAYVGAWCWDECFLPFLAAQGHVSHAVSLRGHGGSRRDGAPATAGLDEYVDDVAAFAATLGEAPVLVGHSMGATVVQRALRRVPARAAVLMAPVPPEGVMASAWLLALRDPQLFAEINLMQHAHPHFGSVETLRRALFAGEVAPRRLLEYFRRAQTESPRAILDLSWPQYSWIARDAGVPVLVLGAGRDMFFPPLLVQSTARLWGVTAEFFPRLGHAMMLDEGWEAVAGRIAQWLAATVPAR
jgi:non-heme chloroperoxidase